MHLGLYSYLVSIWPCCFILLYWSCWVCSLKVSCSFRGSFCAVFPSRYPCFCGWEFTNKYSWSQLPCTWLCLWNLYLLQTWLMNTAQVFIWFVCFLAWKPHWDFELLENQVMIYLLKPVIPLDAPIQWKVPSSAHSFVPSSFTQLYFFIPIES